MEFLWQALVGLASELFKNQQRNQFGTLIPFHGDVSNPQTDLLAVVGNALRNAVVLAYLQRYQRINPGLNDLEFDPGSIVDDFVDSVMADPRVNWERRGITGGGFAGIGKHPVEWQASSDGIRRLKHHMSQFIAVATGGPAKYEGREMVEAQHNMKITNAEFDAAVGDLKSTLDKLGVTTTEQRELLAIVESTREQVVESR